MHELVSGGIAGTTVCALMDAAPEPDERRFSGLAVRLFGSTTVLLDGVAAPVSRRQVRQLVTILASRSPAAVSADALVEHLWPGTLPEHPRKALNVALSRLRAALGPYAGRLVAVGDGYRLDADTIDLQRFVELVESAAGFVGLRRSTHFARRCGCGAAILSPTNPTASTSTRVVQRSGNIACRRCHCSVSCWWRLDSTTRFSH